MLAELRRCGLTDSETCLRGLTLSLDGGRTVSAGLGWGGRASRGTTGPPTPASASIPEGSAVEASPCIKAPQILHDYKHARSSVPVGNSG